MRSAIFSLCLFLYGSAYSQTRDEAAAIVDTLASPFMNGRGYSGDGVLNAADYIRNEFAAAGLAKFNNTYNQYFKTDVNIFTDTVFLSVDGVTLTAGTQYIPNSASGSTEGTFKLFYPDSTFVLSDKKIRKSLTSEHSDTYIVADKKLLGENSYKTLIDYVRTLRCLNYAGVIEITDGKLTMGISSTRLGFGHFIVKREAWNDQASSIYCNLNTFLHESYKTQNLIGYVEGNKPDSFIVITAHYDHLGRLGDAGYFPGANDNASGTAMLICLARHFAKPENKPEFTMVFIAFGGEEIGLLGSKHYTDNVLFPLNRIKFLINMDILGTGDDGIKVVNGTVFRTEFDRLVAINEEKQYLKSVQPRGEASISDHYFFTKAGVHCFYIYTLGGIDAYHDLFDKAETLPLTEFDDLFKLLTDFIGGF